MLLMDQIKSHFQDSLTLNTYLILAIRLLGPGGSYVFWVIAARFMIPEAVGISSGYITSAGFLASLSQLGIGYGLVRFIPKNRDSSNLINFAIELVSIAAFMLAFVYVLGLDIWSPGLTTLRYDLWIFLCFLVLVINYSISQLLSWIFLSKRKPIFTLFQSAIQSITSILILVVLVGSGSNIRAPLFAYAFSILISNVISIFVFLSICEPEYQFRLSLPNNGKTNLMKYSLINYLSDQFQRSPETLNTLMVINIMGAEIGAYFFATWALSSGLSNLAASVSPSFLVESTNRPQMTRKYAINALKFGVLFSACLSIIGIVLSKFILSIYGDLYVQNGSQLFVILLVSIIPGVMLPIFLNLLRVKEMLNWLAVISFLSLTIGLLFTYIFMKSFGLIGAGVGWLVSRITMVFIIVILYLINKSDFRQSPRY